MTGAARRDQLLDVTTELVSSGGFRQITIQSVAERAGITRRIVYEHFGDLPGLLDAVVEREMTRALSQVSETALTDLSEGSPVELMIESLRAFLQTVQTHPTTWRLVLMPPEGAPELMRERIAEGRGAVLEQLTGAVGPAFESGGTGPDSELTARILSAISDEYARLVLSDPDRFPAERLLQHARWVLSESPLSRLANPNGPGGSQVDLDAEGPTA